MNEDEPLGLGSCVQLTETTGLGDFAREEYEEELSRKRPPGFAPWPEDATD